MTLDELIKQLEEARRHVGGDTPVGVTGAYASIGDIESVRSSKGPTYAICHIETNLCSG